MKNKKTRILISNDDGITSQGLQALIDILEDEEIEIIAIAPEKEHSGQSHAITIDNILRVKYYQNYKNACMYICSGTPVDCIKAGLFLLSKNTKPDLILSGINLGYNFSVSTWYSGTAAAALEGALAGIPSIALSLGNFNGKTEDFFQAKNFILDIVHTTLKNTFPKDIFLNVNIPNTKNLKGIKVCKLAKGHFSDVFKEEKDPRNKTYYWLSERFNIEKPEDTDNDFCYLQKKYITVVPIHFDITAHYRIDDLKVLYER